MRDQSGRHPGPWSNPDGVLTASWIRHGEISSRWFLRTTWGSPRRTRSDDGTQTGAGLCRRGGAPHACGSLAIGATEGLLGFGNPKQPERAGTLAQSLLDGSGVPAIGPRDTTAANTVWAAGRPVALVTAMAPAQAMNALTAGPGLVGPLLP